MRVYIIGLIAVFLAANFTSATIIHVPGDCPTIQQGIDASFDGDTVLVKPGEYVENVSIFQKDIVLASHFLTTGDTSFISSTIINGDSAGIVIDLREIDGFAIVTGFTIKNGRVQYFFGGGGIRCLTSANIEISYNKIEDNYYISPNDIRGGGGIYCYYSTGVINNNAITDNVVEDGGFGGGIFCRSSQFIIRNNDISFNSACWGGGIALYESDATVNNNVIYENIADI